VLYLLSYRGFISQIIGVKYECWGGGAVLLLGDKRFGKLRRGVYFKLASSKISLDIITKNRVIFYSS
jgi:hypothetical protein